MTESKLVKSFNHKGPEVNILRQIQIYNEKWEREKRQQKMPKMSFNCEAKGKNHGMFRST